MATAGEDRTRPGSRDRRQLAGAGAWSRPEDWIVAASTALAAPVVVGVASSASGPFDGRAPVEGLLGAAGILGVVACLAARRPEPTDGSWAAGAGQFRTAAIGPFVGGLILVAISTGAALGLSGGAAVGLVACLVAAAVAVRLWLPAPRPAVRRALVTPYLLAAAGQFWAAVDAVTGGGSLTAAVRSGVLAGAPGALSATGFLLAYAAVFYAMLVFAPRQVAEPEGGVIVWVARFALFVAAVGVGAGWLLVLGP